MGRSLRSPGSLGALLLLLCVGTGLALLPSSLSPSLLELSKAPCKKWIQDPDIDYPAPQGNPSPDIANVDADSADKCQGLCAKNAKCVKFSFVSNQEGDQKKCFLKSDVFSDRVVKKGTTSGFCGDGGSTGGNCAIVADTDTPGSDLPGTPTKTPTAAACCAACVKNEACFKFTWVARDQNCWLKDDTPVTGVPYIGAYSGRSGFLLTAGGIKVTRANKADPAKFKGVSWSPVKNVNKFLLHTTQGPTMSGAEGTLDKEHFWSSFLLGPEKMAAGTQPVVIKQFVPLTLACKALKAHNDLGVIQVEIVGFATGPAVPYEKGKIKPPTGVDTFTPEVISAVGGLWKAVSDWYGGSIPFSKDPKVEFKDEKTVATGKFRLTYDPKKSSDPTDWTNIKGLVGHQHAPKPDSHWDPGALTDDIINGIITAAGGTAAPAAAATPPAAGQ